MTTPDYLEIINKNDELGTSEAAIWFRLRPHPSPLTQPTPIKVKTESFFYEQLQNCLQISQGQQMSTISQGQKNRVSEIINNRVI